VANIFGVNIESPQEAQQRLLAEHTRQLNTLSDRPGTKLGFNLASIAFNLFAKGGARKTKKRAEEREEAIGEGIREGDLDFIGETERFKSDFAATTRQNARLLRETLMNQGKSPQEATAAAEQYTQAVGNSDKQARVSASAGSIQEEKNRRIEEGQDPVAADLAAMVHTATKLRALGGPENIALANQITSGFAERKRAFDIQQLQMNKLRAEAGTKAGAGGSSSPIEKLQIDREEQRSLMNDPRLNEREQAGAKQRFNELDAKIKKDTDEKDGAVSAAFTGRFVESRRNLLATTSASDAIVDMFDGKPPGTAVAVMDALASAQQLIQATDVWKNALVGNGVVGSTLTAAYDEIVPNLKAQLKAAGLGERDAIRLLQEVQSSINREARAFGGPITEDDRAAAKLSSGIATGRVDLLFDRQLRQSEQDVGGLIAEAQLEGTVKVDEAGNITSDNAVSSQLKKLKANVDESRVKLDAWIATNAPVPDPTNPVVDTQRDSEVTPPVVDEPSVAPPVVGPPGEVTKMILVDGKLVPAWKSGR